MLLKGTLRLVKLVFNEENQQFAAVLWFFFFLFCSCWQAHDNYHFPLFLTWFITTGFVPGWPVLHAPHILADWAIPTNKIKSNAFSLKFHGSAGLYCCTTALCTSRTILLFPHNIATKKVTQNGYNLEQMNVNRPLSGASSSVFNLYPLVSVSPVL